jgi:hypothetical protein
MTKSEIIDRTLREISYRQNPPPDEIADCVDLEGYDDFVIATLNELLPAGDIKTCEDFKELGVECCHTCHTCYPDYHMRVVTLPDGSTAWICCSLRTALLEPNAATTTNMKVAADRAASIIASAEALSSLDAVQRAYDLLHLEREMTPEENVEFCVLMCMPTKYYIE